MYILYPFPQLILVVLDGVTMVAITAGGGKLAIFYSCGYPLNCLHLDFAWGTITLLLTLGRLIVFGNDLSILLLPHLLFVNDHLFFLASIFLYRLSFRRRERRQRFVLTAGV